MIKRYMVEIKDMSFSGKDTDFVKHIKWAMEDIFNCDENFISVEEVIKKMKVKCLNDHCLYHKKDNSCAREEILLGTQGVCII